MNTNLDTLTTHYMNAMMTYAQAGGHFKANANKARADALATQIVAAGGTVPTDDKCFKRGTFNGPGSV